MFCKWWGSWTWAIILLVGMIAALIKLNMQKLISCHSMKNKIYWFMQLYGIWVIGYSILIFTVIFNFLR